MKQFATKSFKIPELRGISTKNIEEHLKLYAGYVKNANLILENIAELKKNIDVTTSAGAGNVYALGEIGRRFGFEYNGMRNHETYFAAFEGGAKPPIDRSPLMTMITETWGSFDMWLAEFRTIAMTRGIGWAMLYYDRKDSRLLNAWVDEQHMGQLQDCTLVLALDMWEHSYVADYQPSGKKAYVEDFFVNLDWDVIENNYSQAGK